MRDKFSNFLVISIAWIIFILAFIFIENIFFQHSVYNADMLYLPSLLNDILIENNGIIGWKLSPQVMLFPDIIIYLIIFLLTKNVKYAYILFSIVQLLLLIFSLRYLLSRILKKKLLINILPVLIITVFVFFASFSDLISYIMIPGMHIGMLILSIISIAIILHFIKKPSKILLTALLLASFLAALSDKLYVISFVVPMGLVLVFLLFSKKFQTKKAISVLIVLFVSCILSSLIPLIIDLVLAENSFLYPISDYSEISLTGIDNSIVNFFVAMKGLYSWPGVFFVLTVLLSMIVNIFCFFNNFKNKDNFFLYKIIFSFIYLSLFFTAFVMIITNNFFDIVSLRYLIVPVSLHVIFFVYFVFINIFKRIRLKYAFYSMIIIILVFIFYNSNFFRNNNISEIINSQDNLVACLDNHKERYNLKYGVADYWNAKKVTAYSKQGIRLYQVDENIFPEHWHNNKNWYLDIKEESYYNFIVLDTIKESKAIDQFGEPDAIFKCISIKIYVYDKKIDFNKKLISRFEEFN